MIGRHRHDRRDGLPDRPRRARRRAERRSTSRSRRSTSRASEVAAASGCLGCHKIGENGNTLGPDLTEIGDRLGRDAIARTLVNPTPPMPSYQTLREENPSSSTSSSQFIASLRSEN